MTQLITIPGLIDPHVHLRDPGQTNKEDFYSGTSAALAGGYTTVIDMPNNLEPITTNERLNNKISIAQSKTVSDIGFHFGSLGDNFDEFPKIFSKVKGLKIYMNVTTGNFIIDKTKLLSIYTAWTVNKPILLHAESDVLGFVMEVVKQTNKTTHICHVSCEEELQFVIDAKKAGLPVSCGVTPHHLFLTKDDEAKLGSYAQMKPSLKDAKDQQFLWDNLEYIDVIESDHAPHTKEEKASNPAPFGVPGLETTLPLMLRAERDGLITREQIIEKLHTNPARIFNIETDETTKVLVSMEEYKLSNEGLKTKAGWTPFAGIDVVGKVKEVVLHGTTVYKDGEVIATPGSGKVIN
jgi:carbamoyl-phosphate synthase/aspartate carbamoyltransferase/dihydroorotase